MAEQFTMELACGGGAVFCESNGEYTLPDYMPEVRRVLRLEATPTVSGQFEGGDKTEVGGEMRYCLVYTDAEGNLASANLDGTFEGSVVVPQGSPLWVYPRVENASCRLGGPRRVSMKAGISLHPHAYRRVNCEIPEVDESAGEVAYLYHPLETSVTEYFSCRDVTLADSVKCEEGTVIIGCDIGPMVREVKCEEGAVCVRGEVWVRALANDMEKHPCVFTCKIPYEESIPCDGVKPGFSGIARCECTSCTCDVAEGSTGWSVQFDMALAIDGMAVENTKTEVITDLYATAYELLPKTEEIVGRSYPVLQMANFTVDGSVPKSDLGCEDTPHPVDARASVTDANPSTDGSAVIIEGGLRVNCILACAAEDGNYRSESFTIPYKIRINCGEMIPQDTELTCDVRCISCRARADGEKLGVDAELAVMLMGCRYDKVAVVTSVIKDSDSPITRADDEVISAYLESGDSLWSIGKRYHIPLEEIVKANSLPDEIMERANCASLLDGLTRLLIV